MPRPLDIDIANSRQSMGGARPIDVAANTKRLAELEANPACRKPGPLLILQNPHAYDPSEVTIKTALFHGQQVPNTIQLSLSPPIDPSHRKGRMVLPPIGNYTHGWPLGCVNVPPASPARQLRRINLYLNWPGYALHDIFSVFMVDTNPERAILDIYEHLSKTFPSTLDAWARAPSDPNGDWTGKWRLAGLDTNRWARHLVLVELVEVWPEMWTPVFRVNIL